ncbi:3'-5' exonuclease [Paenibacillus sp. FSL R5-0887]|uniref:3'-5' exonuclease n=1 Tax=unclassified Paenibacillus TaxID=185978 RepID=UPI0024760CB0|nr:MULTISPECIES: 3'-5' exonuclease [unclassified Paenibacillus]MDH6430704.1 superfamily I DNA/RNA helicase [Paenibacillus sp. PastH-4]MDH6446601.1 superfamily I DNA/RNA helicase [Paenibacillus sp. PastF-4]MDH6530941.1 superfamily I DNA/RNA helicase [Paenibacillus sp. PastH-3]
MKRDITYSAQQKEIINYSGDQLLIRGIAGSGKTLILLEKARDVAAKHPDETVAVFSYGSALTASVIRQLEKYKLPNLTVSTFHLWAMKNYFKTFKKKFYLENFTRQMLLEAIEGVKQEYPKHRFVNNKDLITFIEEEIGWIKGSDLCEFNMYDKAPRKGRGGKVRLSVEDRKVMYKIYEAYQKQLDYRIDYHDFGLQMSRQLGKIQEESKFDHVFIDEAQDFTKVNMQVLCHIARKSCVVGADQGQKIFTTSFTWEGVGLNIKGGRTKVLRNSYRSTKEIMELAYSIQEKDEISKDEEFTRPDLPTKKGPKPKVFYTKGIEEQKKALLEAIELIQKEDPEATIGILSRNKKHMKRVVDLLDGVKKKYHFIKSPFKKTDPDLIGTHHDPGIKLTSFHTAKGLEFKYVFITDLVDPPTEERLGEDFDWNIERRLLYVAMSRAMQVLNLFTYGDRHFLLDELGKAYYQKIVI